MQGRKLYTIVRFISTRVIDKKVATLNMDGFLAILSPFKGISVLFRRWKDDNETLHAS